jgi:hypothetical protein
LKGWNSSNIWEQINEEEEPTRDATSCFITFMIGLTRSGQHYAHHQELTTILLITTWAV